MIQGDALNRSRLATAIVVPLTSNLGWAAAPGNVMLAKKETGLPKDSVANVSQIVTVDKRILSTTGHKVTPESLVGLLQGIDVVLGR